MPRLLEDFLVPALNEGRYKHKLMWDTKENDVFLVLWLHKSKTSWREDDFVVFQDWDKFKGRLKDNKNPQYLTVSKQRFRAALYKLEKVKEIHPARGFENYKRYRIDMHEKKKKRTTIKRAQVKMEPEDGFAVECGDTTSSEIELEKLNLLESYDSDVLPVKLSNGGSYLDSKFMSEILWRHPLTDDFTNFSSDYGFGIDMLSL